MPNVSDPARPAPQVRTNGEVDLPPGKSHLHLRGELVVANEDLAAFGPMMGDYIQGREIPLQNVFLSSTEPLYHKARALSLPTRR